MSDRYAIVETETGLYWVGPTVTKRYSRAGHPVQTEARMRKMFKKEVVSFREDLARKIYRDYEVQRRTIDKELPKVELVRIEHIVKHHSVEQSDPDTSELAMCYYRNAYGSTFATALETVGKKADITTFTHAIKRKGSTFLEVCEIPGAFSSGVFTFFNCPRGLFESQLVLNHDNIVKVYDLEQHHKEISEL